MKRIGKIFLGVLCAAALAAGGFWINDRLSYPIDPGMDGLEGSLTNWLNRGIDAVHGYQPLSLIHITEPTRHDVIS